MILLDEESSLAKANDHTVSVRNNNGKSFTAEQNEYIASALKEKIHFS